MHIGVFSGMGWRRGNLLLALWMCAVMAIHLRADPVPPKPEEIIVQLQQVETMQAKLPRDRFDPGVIVAATSGDPIKLMAWVRDNTRLVFYNGSLRGAAGVLMDRNGNSLDRSVLLARLLELAGYEARIVSAKLPAGEMAKVFADASKAVPPAPAGNDAETKERQGVKEEAARISKMIQEKAGPLSLAPGGPEEGTHYWAQYNDGKAWVDLDATLAESGKSRAQPQGMALVLDAATHSIAQSTELLHTVDMLLLVERWEAGKLVESPLLMLPFDSSRDPVGSLTMTFFPVDQKAAKAVQRPLTTGADLHKRLLLETAWAPMIADGKGSCRMARMFNDAGIVADIPKSFSGAGQLGNAARSGFGDLMGGMADNTEAPTVLTALIADYQITAPGKPFRHVRRFIFDSIGSEARRLSPLQPLPRPKWTEQQRVDRGAELAAQNESLILFAGLPTELYIHRFAGRIIDSKPAVLKMLKGRPDAETMERAAEGVSFRTMEFYSSIRDSMTHPDLVVAEPQIVRRIVRYLPNTNAKDLDFQIISDLAWNRLSSAIGNAAAPKTAAVAIDQGVRDTLLESTIVLRNMPALPGQTTAALFQEAAKQGIEIVAVRDAKNPALANYPAPARELMLLDLAAGQCLIVPAKPVMVDGQPRLGWWRVELGSGQTVGEMDTGLLQSFVEYNVTQIVGFVAMTFFRIMWVGPEAEEWAARMIARGADLPFGLMAAYAQSVMNFSGQLPPH